MYDALRTKIVERKDLISRLDRERSVAEAELRAYEDALRLVMSESDFRNSEAKKHTVVTSDMRRPRRKSAEIWESLIVECAQIRGGVFDIDMILNTASRRQFHPTRGNVRSQMASYVGRAFLERVDQGSFRMTQTGKVAFSESELDHQSPELNTASSEMKDAVTAFRADHVADTSPGRHVSGTQEEEGEQHGLARHPDLILSPS